MYFDEVNGPTPNLDEVKAIYNDVEQTINSSTDVDEMIESLKKWNRLRCEIGTWRSLVDLKNCQDTTNEEYKAAKDESDELMPTLTEFRINLIKQLVNHPMRPELEARIKPQAFKLWESEIPTFDPQIKQDLIDEQKLKNRYNDLTAAAKIQFDGQSQNLSSMMKYQSDSDRKKRQEAARLYWNWFAANQMELDEIFDQQVKLRDGMAKKLGFENYVDLAYLIMQRVDYSQDDVARYRNMVKQDVTPVCEIIRERQAAHIGVDNLAYWDESYFDPTGAPMPQGDHDWMIERAIEMFDEMGQEIGDFFRLMVNGNFMDLKIRDGKAGGGFCTFFDNIGMTYIYANFNGTRGDVEVFTHEVGHAFQGYMSREQAWIDYHWPTYESCEIHSMGLEFLTWPYMEKFFGDKADSFRNVHLASSLLFLPYGVSVDEFQHRVYENPTASPADRHAMWKEIEDKYSPWTDYGDMVHPSSGGRWQAKRHIYMSPFYYIDYTLAQTCALQLWQAAQADRESTLRDYVALCKRGGEAPFQDLVASANLISPFQEGCLKNVVAKSREALGV